MRTTCVRREFIPAVLHAAFSLMGSHYALGSVLLIGKSLNFFLVTVDLSERFSREEHERHCCSLALSCPVKCQLCQSFCSTGDHFHALETDAIHLCG